jgi:hypothetical protein
MTARSKSKFSDFIKLICICVLVGHRFDRNERLELFQMDGSNGRIDHANADNHLTV